MGLKKKHKKKYIKFLHLNDCLFLHAGSMTVVLLIHTWIVAMRGRGCLVLAPPSTAMPSVLALLGTRTNVGPGCPNYNTQRERDRDKDMNTE